MAKDESDDALTQMVWGPAYAFYRDSKMLVRRCAKPDKNEFTKIALATGAGFLVMGFIGFFVKLMFIPINNVIVSNL
ncbi:hypothetical protein GUITHDRAFT_101363 [Guillardia theta CCMP2712]|uniref:Uncharacterized protein n=1 Tax=Guillardia theta (strain CCMP2712) TaxID=905079 RepID=L1JXU6_GUITC|nr:hypothetical protein GUITHDRAFT_101363 [Guillardia theta CCMP2712]EKX52913.1 hypothetical protein GUITHDRAFT_101363 [Guillardia theta CCMP2712]|eukprot:XP_005839893.1 hypothetical protein GUITHDRAFT_101363 [Guillardia theta CCMP2712]